MRTGLAEPRLIPRDPFSREEMKGLVTPVRRDIELLDLLRRVIGPERHLKQMGTIHPFVHGKLGGEGCRLPRL